ncbi:hypothetical protein Patl1_11526 [Pistacia atlantica]|uniref:Uncharacterized protein n=1 Tax=Pistacia atlantica TaxID=434234 RepID=A0ACC1A6B8_9ROSI|nr:hypothetical protein Patl1_11526 [Pistacia atlantica]
MKLPGNGGDSEEKSLSFTSPRWLYRCVVVQNVNGKARVRLETALHHVQD